MRKLVATVFNYSLDGLLADEGTEFWNFCFSLPENSEPGDPAQLEFLPSAYAHIMGRTAYEAIAESMTRTATDHPLADILTAGRKVVFSRTRRRYRDVHPPRGRRAVHRRGAGRQSRACEPPADRGAGAPGGRAELASIRPVKHPETPTPRVARRFAAQPVG
jgi:hypothetical protein